MPFRINVGAPGDVVSTARARAAVSPEYFRALTPQARLHAFTVAELASITQIDEVQRSLTTAFRDGESFTAWRKRVLRGEIPLSLPDHRLETIFRTNMQTAYQVGRGKRAAEHAASHPYLLYSAVMDSRTRPGHAAMHGTVLRIDDPWWHTHRPPNGYNCRCTTISLTEKQAQRIGITPLAPETRPDPGFESDPWRDSLAGIESALEKAAVSTPPPIAAHATQTAEIAALLKDSVTTIDGAISKGRDALALIDRQLAAKGIRLTSATPAAAQGFSDALGYLITAAHGAPVAASITRKMGSGYGAKLVTQASQRFPATWVEVANQAGDLAVFGGTRRAYQVSIRDGQQAGLYRLPGPREPFHMKPGDGFIYTRNDVRVAVHEYGHRIQYALPDLDALFQGYFRRRTQHDALERLSDLTGNPAYAATEVAKRDRFIDPYYGKVYGDQGALEMLTMSLDAILAPTGTTRFWTLYKDDRELFNLAVGLLLGYKP